MLEEFNKVIQELQVHIFSRGNDIIDGGTLKDVDDNDFRFFSVKFESSKKSNDGTICMSSVGTYVKSSYSPSMINQIHDFEKITLVCQLTTRLIQSSMFFNIRFM